MLQESLEEHEIARLMLLGMLADLPSETRDAIVGHKRRLRAVLNEIYSASGQDATILALALIGAELRRARGTGDLNAWLAGDA